MVEILLSVSGISIQYCSQIHSHLSCSSVENDQNNHILVETVCFFRTMNR